jgi:hypothetical protein
MDLFALDAHGVRMKRIADGMCHTLPAGAVESPLMIGAEDDLSVEGGLVQRHIRMRTASAIGLQLAARRPDKEHALTAGLKESHTPFAHGAGVTDKGECHRNCLSKLDACRRLANCRPQMRQADPAVPNTNGTEADRLKGTRNSTALYGSTLAFR